MNVPALKVDGVGTVVATPPVGTVYQFKVFPVVAVADKGAAISFTQY